MNTRMGLAPSSLPVHLMNVTDTLEGITLSYDRQQETSTLGAAHWEGCPAWLWSDVECTAEVCFDFPRCTYLFETIF